MKNLFTAICVAVLMTVAAFSQGSSDNKKGEFFIGYSNRQIDTGFKAEDLDGVFSTSDLESFNGFNVSGVYNLNKYIGLKADVSGTYNSNRFSQSFNAGGTVYTVGLKTDSSLYNFLGGVQVKNNAKSGTFKPFAHALVGVGHVRAKVSDFTCSPTASCPVFDFPDETFSDNGLAAAFGGGLDIRLSDRVQIRAIQVDYNPVRIEGVAGHNFRFGVGIVF